MSNYYKEVPVTQKPKKDGMYNTNIGEVAYSTKHEQWNCLRPDKIKYWLQPIEPVGLTDEQIAKLIHRLIIDPTCDYEAELLANEIRDHYSLLLSAEKDRQGELMEWISRMDISQNNDGKWYKNNHAFKYRPFAETTTELIELFTEQSKNT